MPIQMHVKFNTPLEKRINLSLSALLVFINSVFESYEQSSTVTEGESVSDAPVILPIVEFKQKALLLKEQNKKASCDVRFILYSKEEDANKECLNFIWPHRLIDKHSFYKLLPKVLKESHFDLEQDQTLLGLLSTLETVEADVVKYFYSSVTTEGETYHSVALVHLFGSDTAPNFVATTYFSIKASK